MGKISIQLEEHTARKYLQLCKEAKNLTPETLFVLQQIESRLPDNQEVLGRIFEATKAVNTALEELSKYRFTDFADSVTNWGELEEIDGIMTGVLDDLTYLSGVMSHTQWTFNNADRKAKDAERVEKH